MKKNFVKPDGVKPLSAFEPRALFDPLRLTRFEFLGNFVREQPVVNPKIRPSISDIRSRLNLARIRKKKFAARLVQQNFADFCAKQKVTKKGALIVIDLCLKKLAAPIENGGRIRNSYGLALAIEREVTFLPSERTHILADWIYNRLYAKTGLAALEEERKRLIAEIG